MPPAARPSSTPNDRNTPPRQNWLVALTTGILRGIASLLTAIALRLEARPNDPRPSLGVWGLTIALGVTIAIVTGRSPTMSPITSPLTSPMVDKSTTAMTDLPEPETRSGLEDEPDGGLGLPSTPSDLPSTPEADLRSPTLANDSTTESLDPDRGTEPDGQLELDETAALDPSASTLTPSEEGGVDSLENDRDRERLPEIPDELTAPTPALALEPAPPPLTPEQRLIAALQERIAAISEDYATEAIVTTVRVDFAHNHLDVELADRWYDLAETEQDRFASDLRNRGEQFDFYDINLVDASGELVARPAAIGNAMIVVRRLRD